MKAKKILASLLSAALVVSSFGFQSIDVRAEEHKGIKAAIQEVEGSEDLQKLLDSVRLDSSDLLKVKEPDAETLVHIIVELDGKAILEMNPDAEMDLKNQLTTTALELAQTATLSRIEKEVFAGEKLDVTYQYTWLFNGIALEVPYKTVKEIEKVKGVAGVIVEPVYSVSNEESAELKTIFDGQMIQRQDAWDSGYTGKGMKIAIVDTGLDLDHPNFAALSEDKLTEDSETLEKVEEVYTSLHAYKRYVGLDDSWEDDEEEEAEEVAGEATEEKKELKELSASQLYLSTKVPFAFNYSDDNLTVDHSADKQGTHGTHVAGIAAANKIEESEVVGVAPDAQLYVMKVFGAKRAGYTSDIMAALEDALILGADVVNMSLGSTAGFTTGGDIVDRIYGSVSNTGTVLCISAGNETTAGQYNRIGLDKSFAMDPDNGAVGAPGTYSSATTIASVENYKLSQAYFACGDYKFAYNIPTAKGRKDIFDYEGQELQFVPVGNLGQSLDDFAGVKGKVALVQRGAITFAEKIQNAEDAGAIACVIYNNTSGTIGMDLSTAESTIPAFSITQEAGLKLVEAYEANSEATISIVDAETFFDNSAAGQMSTFTSWGVTPELTLEPDLAAPGGHIYSTVDGGGYSDMSGTSMASPNAAGVSALIMQYAKANYDLSGVELRNFVNAVLMSTASPIAYDEETPYSPRVQGSGLVSTFDAMMTRAYLSVEGMDFPKVNLYDDVEKKGQYSFSFDVNNFGTSTLFYDLSTTAQTELVSVAYGIPFMSGTPVSLDADTTSTSDSMLYKYDFNEDGDVNILDAAKLYYEVLDGTVNSDEEFRLELDGEEGINIADVQAYLDALVGKDQTTDLDQTVFGVKAGEKATVNVTVTLTDSDKEYMDDYFENGIYVEGYSFVSPLNKDGVELSLPYLAFYGDWTAAPIFDRGYYYEGDDSLASAYNHYILGNYGEKQTIPGQNPYIKEDFDINNIAFSPNDDGYLDSIADLYISLLRNVKTIDFKVVDSETGDVYYHDFGSYFRKSTYNYDYGICMPFVFSNYLDEGEVVYDFTRTVMDGEEEKKEILPNNTKVDFVVSGELDYDRHEAADNNEVVFSIVVDTEAPFLYAGATEILTQGDKEYLVVYASDNHNVAAALLADSEFTKMLGASGKVQEVADGIYAFVMDITGLTGDTYLIVSDYAMNEDYFMINLDDLRKAIEEEKEKQEDRKEEGTPEEDDETEGVEDGE